MPVDIPPHAPRLSPGGRHRPDLPQAPPEGVPRRPEVVPPPPVDDANPGPDVVAPKDPEIGTPGDIPGNPVDELPHGGRIV
jgi:hypothetical protein